MTSVQRDQLLPTTPEVSFEIVITLASDDSCGEGLGTRLATAISPCFFRQIRPSLAFELFDGP